MVSMGMIYEWYLVDSGHPNNNEQKMNKKKYNFINLSQNKFFGKGSTESFFKC